MVANGECSVPEMFSNENTSSYIGQCYAGWATTSAHDQSTFSGVSKAVSAPMLCGEQGSESGTAACEPNRYTWQAATESGLGSFTGRQNSYDGSGYALTLPSDSSSARAMLATLQADAFLGPQVRCGCTPVIRLHGCRLPLSLCAAGCSAILLPVPSSLVLSR